jgi:hypothetical protein
MFGLSLSSGGSARLRSIGLMIAIALLVGSGVVHGLWTDRWFNPAEVEAAAAKLDRIPMKLGDWDGKDMPMSDSDKEMGGANRYVMRRYKNRTTGIVVNMLILCGRPGPVSVHTPDVCYAGDGYEALSDPQRQKVPTDGGGPEVQVLRQTFGKGLQYTRVFWSWRGGSKWEVSKSPRIEFAHYRALYKVYVARRMKQKDESPDEDPCIGFLETLMRELEEKVFEKKPALAPLKV